MFFSPYFSMATSSGSPHAPYSSGVYTVVATFE